MNLSGLSISLRHTLWEIMQRGKFMLKKITEGNISGLNVKSVPGVRLTGTVAENKNVFDKLPEFIAQTYNSLIDALSSSADGDSGANCINITPIAGLTGTEVQLSLIHIQTGGLFRKLQGFRIR